MILTLVSVISILTEVFYSMSVRFLRLPLDLGGRLYLQSRQRQTVAGEQKSAFLGINASIIQGLGLGQTSNFCCATLVAQQNARNKCLV